MLFMLTWAGTGGLAGPLDRTQLLRYIARDGETAELDARTWIDSGSTGMYRGKDFANRWYEVERL